MHKLTKGILVAGAASLAASFVAPNPALAEPNHTAGMPGKCYQWPTERLDIAWMVGMTAHTDDIQVTPGSPCLDVNVRAVQDVDGHAACRNLRVRWSSGKTTPWRKVCRGWTVLAYGAHEGDMYVVEGHGRPSTVQVRS